MARLGTAMIFLMACAVQDMRKREVSWSVLGLGGAAAIAFQAAARELELWDLAGGAGVGLLLIGAAFFTGEALGYGDGAAVGVLGIFLGFGLTVEILLLALFAAACVSGFLLIFKKAKRNDTLPFLPFLTAAAALCIWMEGTG